MPDFAHEFRKAIFFSDDVIQSPSGSLNHLLILRRNKGWRRDCVQGQSVLAELLRDRGARLFSHICVGVRMVQTIPGVACAVGTITSHVWRRICDQDDYALGVGPEG